jgi:hypothetical protein
MILLGLSLAVAIGLALPGCEDEDLATGRLLLVIGDAPFPLEMISAAEITIGSVSVRSSSNEGERWESMPAHGGTFDLLSLRNGITTELAAFDLPAGEVDQIRLQILSGHVQLTDGRSFDLKVPSGMSSGLKVFPAPPIVVAGGLTTDVLLDVDLARSFRSIPAAPRKTDDIRTFHFNPSLRVANLTTSGSVAGFVYSTEGTDELDDDVPLGGVAVEAYPLDSPEFDSGTDGADALTESNGLYRILGLRAGRWAIVARPASHATDSTVVEIVPGNESVAEDLRLEPKS